MKPTPSTTTVILPDADASIAAVRSLAAAIQERHRKNCHEAVLAGMHLLYLKDQSELSHGGDRRSLAAAADARRSFSAVLVAVEIPRSSAYRWMGKAQELATELHIPCEPFPLPGSSEWDTIAGRAEQWAETTSIDRLQVGATADDPDSTRMEHLMSQAEAGDEDALMWIDRWRAGQITLARAVCAYGGAEATKGKTRKDPVYLDYDAVHKVPVGLLPKAFTTLSNGFKNWNEYDADARAGLKKQWLQVIKSTPVELTAMLIK